VQDEDETCIESRYLTIKNIWKFTFLAHVVTWYLFNEQSKYLLYLVLILFYFSTKCFFQY